MPAPVLHTSLVDRVERLQAISRLSPDEWLDLLHITWREYRNFQLGKMELPPAVVARIEGFFQLAAQGLLREDPNFEELAVRFQSIPRELPEEFLIAAQGRRRTTITSMDFIEKRYGWRLRHDLLNHFRVDESSLRDAFAPISIRFMEEVCSYLQKRQFRKDDIFHMGRYSLEGNIHSMVGHILSSCEDLDDLCQTYFNRLVSIFETNWTYHYSSLSPRTGLVTAKTNVAVANELGSKIVGSPSICELRRGMFSSLPGYLGYTDARVTHMQCEHRGDNACVTLIDMDGCRPLSSSDH